MTRSAHLPPIEEPPPDQEPPPHPPPDNEPPEPPIEEPPIEDLRVSRDRLPHLTIHGAKRFGYVNRRSVPFG